MNETTLRVLSGIAAVALLASPLIARGWRSLSDFVADRRPTPAAGNATSTADMQTVLNLAARLKAAGMDDGVRLCQQLLDVMLGMKQQPSKK